MQEIWKDIKGYEGYYQISNFGNVKSLKFNHGTRSKLLKPFDNEGYTRVKLFIKNNGKRFLVHRLVAENFIPNPKNKPFVNHIDGNKSNNFVENLEWVTSSENVVHAIQNGLRPPNVICKRKKGKDNPLSKPLNQYDINGNLIAHWNCAQEVCDVLGFTYSCIIRCCQGGRKTYKGYIWKYCEKQI